MLDVLQKEGYDTYGVGKIYDIFAGKGIAHTPVSYTHLDVYKRQTQYDEQNGRRCFRWSKGNMYGMDFLFDNSCVLG